MQCIERLWGCAILTVLACATACGGRAPEASATAPGPDVAARVGDHTITIEEVDTTARKADIQPFQAVYEARRSALDGLVAEELIRQEAASRGVSEQDLVQQEVTSKIRPVSDDDVKNFYDQNKSRMGGRKLEELSDQIRRFLTQQETNRARQDLLSRLTEKRGVKITLDAPRADISIGADEPSRGPSGAKVTIVEYADFQCPYCGRVAPTLDKIMQTYGDRVRLVYRDFPLPMHSNALPAAEAAQCARAQGKFWEYHDELFKNQQALSGDDLKKYASDVGLDVTAFNDCMNSGQFRHAIQASAQQGSRVGVSGTPAFFINGRFLSGARPFEDFRKVIDDELSR